jgi:NAD(P)-dependent dehydrogenase (short-subunit alcohol dehydrogenase family)
MSTGSGTTALITGATGGIGFHVAAALSRLGMHVIVTGRDETRGRQAIAELRTHAGHDRIDLMLADSSLVRENLRLADEVKERLYRLDILVNNVGGGVFAQRVETTEGIEANLARNFLGPFALTTRLLPLLTESAPARIVNVVSSAFAMWKRDPFEDVNARQNYVGIEAHAHAKLLNLLFTLALARRLAPSRVSVNAVNPGMAWTPGVAALAPEAIPQWRFIWPVVRWFQRRASPEKAAQAVIYLASSPDAIGTGKYFDGSKETSLPARLLDPAVQDRVSNLGELFVADPCRLTSGAGVLWGEG